MEVCVGQMGTEDIKNSMFSSEKRVEVLTYGKGKKQHEAEAQLEALMGNNPELRRDFIFENIDFDLLGD